MSVKIPKNNAGEAEKAEEIQDADEEAESVTETLLPKHAAGYHRQDSVDRGYDNHHDTDQEKEPGVHRWATDYQGDSTFGLGADRDK